MCVKIGSCSRVEAVEFKPAGVAEVPGQAPERDATGLPRLEVRSLAEALAEMTVGSAVLAPAGLTYEYVKSACSKMRERGCRYMVSRRSGAPVIVRLK